MPLQTYTYNRVTYYVDYRMRQFRSAVPYPETIDFIEWDSDKGDRILCKMIRDGKADLTKIDF